MNVIIHHYTYHKKNCSHWGEARETPPESYCSTIPKGLTPQRLLILALVKAFSVPPELYEEVARLTGHPLNQIIRMFKEVHMREKKKFTRFRTLQEFRNRYYCEMISLQYQIEQCIDSDEKQQLESRLSRTNELLENARNRLNSYNLRVSHQTVAEVLGIPKGTVDSSMFYIKRRSFEPSVDLG